jgi:hypothetical protein
LCRANIDEDSCVAKKKSKSVGKPLRSTKPMTTATATRSKSAKKVDQPTPNAPIDDTPSTVSKGESKQLTNETIGEAAGAIWSCLDSNGPQTLAKLKKSVDLPAEVTLAAVGWLAREGKLVFDNSARAVTISLG